MSDSSDPLPVVVNYGSPSTPRPRSLVAGAAAVVAWLIVGFVAFVAVEFLILYTVHFILVPFEFLYWPMAFFELFIFLGLHSILATVLLLALNGKLPGAKRS
jgi:hypothetical protein